MRRKITAKRLQAARRKAVNAGTWKKLVLDSGMSETTLRKHGINPSGADSGGGVTAATRAVNLSASASEVIAPATSVAVEDEVDALERYGSVDALWSDVMSQVRSNPKHIESLLNGECEFTDEGQLMHSETKTIIAGEPLRNSGVQMSDEATAIIVQQFNESLVLLEHGYDCDDHKTLTDCAEDDYFWEL